MPKTESRNDKLRAAHEKLQEAVAEIASGDDWKRMLQVASKFHRYSFHNQLLIFCQCPDATLVAGFHKWRSMGRFVKKGEKGIAIFAPCKYRTKIEHDDGDENTVASGFDLGSSGSSGFSAVDVAAPSGDRRKTEIIRGFRVVHVFDISQTEGEEIPDLDAVRPKLLHGGAPEGLWDALVSQANEAGFEVVRDQKRGENGYCDFLKKQIGVRPDVSPAQAVKTLVHELAHALLHGDDVVRSREIQEVEVESAAFVVLDALGLQSGEYSFPYVARWANGDVETIKETGERVVGCAKTILEGLEVVSSNDKAMEQAS